MIALWKKDAGWMSLFFVAATTVFTIALFDGHSDAHWIEGERRVFGDTLIGWWIAAAVFGLYAGLRDRLLGTREYLLHRPVRPEKVFWVRFLGCAIVMAAAVTLSWLIAWFWPYDDENRAVWEFGRVGTVLTLSTSMWPMLAISMYAGTVAAPRVSALLLTGLIGVPVAYLSWRAMFPFGEAVTVSTWFYIAVQAALAVAVLAMSVMNFVRGQDVDRDVAPRLKSITMALAAIGAVLLSSIGISELQREGYKGLLWGYPRIHELDDGRFVGVTTFWNGQRSVAQIVGEDHEPTGELLDHRRVKRKWFDRRGGTRWPDVERQLEPEHERYGPAVGGTRRVLPFHGRNDYDHRAYFRLPEGDVVVYGLSRRHFFGGVGEWRPPWTRTIRRPDQRAFSRRARFDAWDGSLLALDPADSSLWSVTLGRNAGDFAALKLPDGDRPQRLLRLNRIVDPKTHRSREYMAVYGEKETYVWEDGRFVLAPERLRRLRGDPSVVRAKNQTRMARRVEEGPLSFTLAAIGEDGATLFETRLEPRTAREKYHSALVHVATILRAPVLAVASLGMETPGIWPFDPFLTYGGRLWLVALNLGYAALLVWFARRRLKRYGANRFTKTLWTVLIGLGGVAVFILFRLVERKRAHAPVPVVAQEGARPLLIQTAPVV